jgi:hypothetical protein
MENFMAEDATGGNGATATNTSGGTGAQTANYMAKSLPNDEKTKEEKIAQNKEKDGMDKEGLLKMLVSFLANALGISQDVTKHLLNGTENQVAAGADPKQAVQEQAQKTIHPDVLTQARDAHLATGANVTNGQNASRANEPNHGVVAYNRQPQVGAVVGV